MDLFKVSVSTGKMQVWSASVEGAVITAVYGQLGGKMQEQLTACEPKNVGRSNETTAEEQALVELEALYKAQQANKHYRITQQAAVDFANSNREPRKILDYKKGFKKMSPTLLSSNKKNGSRACVLEGTLHSKIGKPEEIKVDHLRKVVEELGIQAHFDAEVFAPELSLQRIRSAWLKPVKTEKEVISIAKKRAKDRDQEVVIKSFTQATDYLGYNPNEDAALLKFFVFDLPIVGIPFEERVELMGDYEEFVSQTVSEPHHMQFIYPVETTSHEERMEMLLEVCAEGEEGLVHYEPLGMYEFGKRSDNAQKSKPRYDSESRVVGVIEDKNGNGTLECIACDALDNVKFKCVMKVDRRDGKSYPKTFAAMQELVGKWITFSYEELSDKGVPTKPVGEMERECDEEGNPLS